MNSKNAWKTFESTGSVQDYLTYKNESTGRRKENTDANDYHGSGASRNQNRLGGPGSVHSHT